MLLGHSKTCSLVEGKARLSGTGDEMLFPALLLLPLIILKIPDGALASLK